MKKGHYVAAVGALFLTTICQTALAGTIEAINHTKWAINHFSVDGQSGIDIIGPYQGGGGGCCYSVPSKWKPGMTVRVEWETGAGNMEGFPGFADREKYNLWRTKMKAKTREHSAIVPMPDYTGQETCGITVHFLSCDEVKVTTSCANYGRPGYPIKEPIRMAEPKVCTK
ncbi:TPA: DUF3304 domain-containing protein [Enterobacter cancerogenus]